LRGTETDDGRKTVKDNDGIYDAKTSAATMGGGTTLRLEDVLAAVDKLRSEPVANKWILVDPQGMAYAGTLTQVLSYLLSQHPHMIMWRASAQGTT
jgi:tRNA G37 N-methylase TrmD